MRYSVCQRRRWWPGQIVSGVACSVCHDPWQGLLEEMSLWSTCLQPHWQPPSNINYTHNSSSLWLHWYIAITTGVIAPLYTSNSKQVAVCFSSQLTLVHVKTTNIACSFTVGLRLNKKWGGVPAAITDQLWDTDVCRTDEISILAHAKPFYQQ